MKINFILFRLLTTQMYIFHDELNHYNCCLLMLRIIEYLLIINVYVQFYVVLRLFFKHSLTKTELSKSKLIENKKTSINSLVINMGVGWF